MIDHRIDEIRALTDRLQKCLVDAERVRARFTKALERDSWPNVEGVMARLLAASDPRGH